jgi:hypothetical protein
MCILRFATVEQSLLQTLQNILPSCTGLWSARLVLLENSFPQISQGKLYCGSPHARAASKWSRNKTALERVQNLYYRLFDLYGFTGHKFPGGLFSGVDSGCSLLTRLFHRLCRWSCHHVLLCGWTDSWEFQTCCHTEGTGRALAFHRSLSDINRDWQETHSSIERDLQQGKEWKSMLVGRLVLHHQRYSWLLNFESELAVGRLHVPCKVTSSGFHFSTLLTSGLSFMRCCAVRQTLVGSEGLFTKHALKLLGLRISIISSYR